MVHALSLGAAHYVGFEDGICGRKWKITRRICFATS